MPLGKPGKTDSFLQYLGVKKIDLLLWDNTESREWSPVQLSVPIMNVSAAKRGKTVRLRTRYCGGLWVNKIVPGGEPMKGLYVMGTGPRGL